MKIIVAGGTGVIGRALLPALIQKGNLMLSNEYYRMSIEARRKIKQGEIINENQPDSSGSVDFK